MAALHGDEQWRFAVIVGPGKQRLDGRETRILHHAGPCCRNPGGHREMRCGGRYSPLQLLHIARLG